MILSSRSCQREWEHRCTTKHSHQRMKTLSGTRVRLQPTHLQNFKMQFSITGEKTCAFMMERRNLPLYMKLSVSGQTYWQNVEKTCHSCQRTPAANTLVYSLAVPLQHVGQCLGQSIGEFVPQFCKISHCHYSDSLVMCVNVCTSACSASYWLTWLAARIQKGEFVEMGQLFPEFLSCHKEEDIDSKYKVKGIGEAGK